MTCCTDGGEIWHVGVDRSPRAKFHSYQCNGKGIGPQKLKILVKFDQTWEYNCPTGAYPLRDFHEICRAGSSFQNALNVKIWIDLLKALRSYGGF